MDNPLRTNLQVCEPLIHIVHQAPHPKRSEYTLLEWIGGGVSGSVYKVLHNLTGRMFAMKIYEESECNDFLSGGVEQEEWCLKVLRSRFIVKMYEMFHEKSLDGKITSFMITNLADTDLESYMTRNNGLGSDNLDLLLVKRVMFQLLSGLRICHLTGVIHQDLKPANIMVGEASLTFKIGDFGNSGYIPAAGVVQYSRDMTSLYYRAPEMLFGCQTYTEKIDLWSLGCIFAELVAGRPIFAGEGEDGQLFDILYLLGTPAISDWPELAAAKHWEEDLPYWRGMGLTHECPRFAVLGDSGLKLLGELLQVNPHNRISITTARQSSFFDEVRSDYAGETKE